MLLGLQPIQVIDGKIVIDPALVKISSGNLHLSENIECTFQEPNTFRFTWTPSYREADTYDQLMVLAYDIQNRYPYEELYRNERSCVFRKQQLNISRVHLT